MPEIVADGQPFQSSPEVANQSYASTPPAFSNYFHALFEDSSPVAALQRASERGTQQGASSFDRFMTVTGQAQEGIVTPGQSSNVQAPEQSPTLSADDANKRYAPQGTMITNKPITEGLAQIIGKQKQAEMDREDVISRASAAHSWPTNFLAGMAAFTLDPLNAATLLIPGIGEEAVTAALGKGALARVGGRAVAGATGAVAGQAPLVGLHVGLSEEEAGDYQARDALRDLFYSAAGGAVLQPIFGALGDRFAPKPIEGRTPPAPLPTNPDDHAAAMRAGISQILEGRPVDVEPVVKITPPRRPYDIIDFLMSKGGVMDHSGELEAMDLNRPIKGKWGTLSRSLGLSMDYAREAAETAGYLRHDSDINDLLDAIAETTHGNPRYVEDDEDVMRWREWQAYASHGPEEIGKQQKQLYDNGYGQSISQAEFEAVNEQVYGERPPAEEAVAPEPVKPAAPAAENPTAEPALKPATPDEKDAADLEQQWKTMTASAPIKLNAEQLAELRSASADFDKAVRATEGHTQAAACINEAGI